MLPAPPHPCSYNRLYTLNATCTAADLNEYGPVLKRIVDSFTPPPPQAV